MSFKFSGVLNTALVLYVPSYETKQGVVVKTFPAQGIRINGSVRSFGGTERDVNGVYSIEDTAVVETWYRPDIQADCRIGIAGTDKVYDILGEPEDIELRHQYLRFKVRRVKGKA